MVLGLNVRGRIWWIRSSEDDSVGGALVTGTVVHSDVGARIQQQPAEMVLLQQGFETNKVFTAIMEPVTLDMEERYEFEVTVPLDYYLYGKRMRMINVRPADFTPSDPRNYVMCELTRSEKAHAIQ